jgi:predicted  nucleic acid-binding Zn-ribbon protein
MTIDERLEALTQSVELLASLHKDNEKRIAEFHEREARLRVALMSGMAAFLRELGGEGDAPNGR